MTAIQSHAGLAPGFGDTVHDAQEVFRAVLRAMSRPGEVQEIAIALVPPAPLMPAAAAVCLSLLDFETPLWIDGGQDAAAAAAFVAFHTGAPTAADVDQADFAVIADGARVPALDVFRQGTDEAPERSATLIIQVSGLAAAAPGDGGWRLTGPGIDGTAGLRVTGLRAGMADELAANFQRFPRGVDVILCAGKRLAALPRTTRVEG